MSQKAGLDCKFLMTPSTYTSRAIWHSILVVFQLHCNASHGCSIAKVHFVYTSSPGKKQRAWYVIKNDVKLPNYFFCFVLFCFLFVYLFCFVFCLFVWTFCPPKIEIYVTFEFKIVA